MWQRFTEYARRAVFLAQEEARRRNESAVSPEHLLRGLVEPGNTLVSRILAALCVAPEQIAGSLDEVLITSTKPPKPDFSLSPRSAVVIDMAYSEARLLGNDYIGTEHLLLGVVRENKGISGQTLRRLNVSLPHMREIVREIQASEHSSRELLRAAKHAAPSPDQMLRSVTQNPNSDPNELLRPETGNDSASASPSRSGLRLFDWLRARRN